MNGNKSLSTIMNSEGEAIKHVEKILYRLKIISGFIVLFLS